MLHEDLNINCEKITHKEDDAFSVSIQSEEDVDRIMNLVYILIYEAHNKADIDVIKTGDSYRVMFYIGG